MFCVVHSVASEHCRAAPGSGLLRVLLHPSPAHGGSPIWSCYPPQLSRLWGKNVCHYLFMKNICGNGGRCSRSVQVDMLEKRQCDDVRQWLSKCSAGRFFHSPPQILMIHENGCLRKPLSAQQCVFIFLLQLHFFPIFCVIGRTGSSLLSLFSACWALTDVSVLLTNDVTDADS